ncbi:MAG: hypothetical protein ACRDPK_03090 [Carbonactinosporaceae bacterium]
MDLARLQATRQFVVRQRFTMMVNRYVVTAAQPDGSEDHVVAFAQQKRMAFREHVTFYTDESRRSAAFSFRARSVMDVGTAYDVAAPDGTPLGLFRKDFGASLLRSTWHLESHGLPPATGHERSLPLAVVRRVWDFVPFLGDVPFPFPYHFDFDAGGRRVMTVDKRISLRDTYVVDIVDDALDRRLAIAQAVALDALQSR